MPRTSKPKKPSTKSSSKRGNTAVKQSATKPSDTRLANFSDTWKKAIQRRQFTLDEIYDLAPGIYEGIPFDLYCYIRAVNASSLKRLKLSPMHYRYTPAQDETPALSFGSLCHAGHLEPERLANEYVVMPEDEWLKEIPPDPKTGKPYLSPKATGWWKDKRREFQIQHEGKQFVTLQQYNDLLGAITALARDPLTQEKFADGSPEVTIVWIDSATKVRCKGRIDWLRYEAREIHDLKTIVDLSRFTNNLGDFNYHVQGCFYQQGLQTLLKETFTPWFAAIESCEPYGVQIAPLGPKALAIAREEVAHYLSVIANCTIAKRWPGPKHPTAWELPRYYDTEAYRRFY